MSKKKTAPKKSTKKVVARKPASVKTTTRTRSTSKRNLLQEYLHQREHFFATHSQVRWLLALFVVSVALYIAVVIRANYVMQVSAMMQDEGLEYDAKVIPWLGW